MSEEANNMPTVNTQCPGTMDIDRLISLAKGDNNVEDKIKELEEVIDGLRASRNKWKADYGVLEEKYAKEIAEKNKDYERLQETLAEQNLQLVTLNKQYTNLLSEKNVAVSKIEALEESLEEGVESAAELQKSLLDAGVKRLELEKKAREANENFRKRIAEVTWWEFIVSRFRR